MKKMRYLITLILTASTLLSFGQSDRIKVKETKPDISVSTIYMLDETWAPRAGQHWPTEEGTSYVQIVSGEWKSSTQKWFVISYRARGKQLYYSGEIESWVETDGKIHFWVRGRGNTTATLSFDIMFMEDGKVGMHMYNTLGMFDEYYSGHKATLEEVNKLLKYYIKEE